jgi:hypothetical protein
MSGSALASCRKAMPFVALLAVLSISAEANATVTIGSNLGRAPTVLTGCDPSCTRVGASLAPTAVSPGGLASPVNGTVVTWRIRVGSSAAPTTFRVVRRFPGDLASGAGTSATVTPSIQAISAFPTRLPIAIGEWIGVDCCVGGGGMIGVSGGSGTTDLWLPALADGGMPRARFQFGPQDMFETAINADIEPTATLDSVKAKPKKGGKIKVSLVAPNPGKLFATGKGLHSTTKEVPAAGPFTLVVKPYFRTKRKLADGKRVKAKLKLTFTPTGGSAAVQAVKVKLKS